MTSPLSPGPPARRHISVQDMLPTASGGLLWDVINNFVGLAGRPLNIYLCESFVRCRQNRLSRFFSAVAFFLHFWRSNRSKTVRPVAPARHSKETSICIFCHAERSTTQGGQGQTWEKTPARWVLYRSERHATYGRAPSGRPSSLMLRACAHGHFRILLLFWMSVKK